MSVINKNKFFFYIFPLRIRYSILFTSTILDFTINIIWKQMKGSDYKFIDFHSFHVNFVFSQELSYPDQGDAIQRVIDACGSPPTVSID